ncbi:MAG TPA: DUF4349 domain-containing protein [Acidobacteriota bacterium]|nr:DUF4349 domain-containing protein [Acidobacteriota bacterium]
MKVAKLPPAETELFLATPAVESSQRETAALELPKSVASTAVAGSEIRITGARLPDRTHDSRKVILKGQYGLTVKSFDPFFANLQRQVSQDGGYISDISTARGSGIVSRASIAVRIPVGGVEPFIDWLRRQGVITKESGTSEDVTEEYVDIGARLENARRFEARLLQMLQNHTAKLSDLVLVEEKLSNIREQIERYEGKLRYFDKFVAFSTLTIEVTVEEPYRPAVERTFWHRAARVWSESIRGLLDFGQGIALAIIAFLPWSIPSALIIFRLLFALRHIRRRTLPGTR